MRALLSKDIRVRVCDQIHIRSIHFDYTQEGLSVSRVGFETIATDESQPAVWDVLGETPRLAQAQRLVCRHVRDLLLSMRSQDGVGA